MKRRLTSITLIWLALSAEAEILPGFRLEMVGSTNGFLTSIDFDSNDLLHYTTMDGGVWVLTADGESVEIARVDSANEGNAALLGMAFDRDESIVLHYVSADLLADVVSRVDRETGEEVVLARLQCSSTGRPCPTEHHGGNPVIAPDGSIYFGIGDYGLMNIALRDDVPAAKIYRIAPTGELEVWAKGFRNPFDLAWDAEHDRLVGGDNGASASDDEIIFVEQGENHGWPLTMGNLPPVAGATPPVYVFPDRVAPTGVTIAAAEHGWFTQGLLVTSFVTRALYYFPRIGVSSIDAPVRILTGVTTPLIDVRQNSRGKLFVASGFAIYRLELPIPGDVDGDGNVTRLDRTLLLEEIEDSGGGRVEHAQDGAFRASWGADANQDGVIDSRDLAELNRLLAGRGRSVGHPSHADRARPLTREGGR